MFAGVGMDSEPCRGVATVGRRLFVENMGKRCNCGRVRMKKRAKILWIVIFFVILYVLMAGTEKVLA